jgi:hypothetical protein|nr:MAG TPA: hypothetical protein [Caudoviricetes sp.]
MSKYWKNIGNNKYGKPCYALYFTPFGEDESDDAVIAIVAQDNEDTKYYNYTCVPIRLGDLYEGMELGQCLDIIKTVKDNSIVAGIEVMKNQGHSGMSWGLMKSMIYTFCDCGNEFVEALDNM